MEQLYNLNMERTVLSSIMSSFDKYEEIFDEITPSDFYLDGHKKIFEQMITLNTKDEPVNEEFIKNGILQNHKNFDEQILVDVFTSSPIANIKSYVKHVKDFAIKRALLDFSTQIRIDTVEENLENEELIDKVHSSLNKITDSTTSTDTLNNSTIITKKTLEYINKMKEKGNSYLIGCETGFRDLNKKTSGFGEGDLVIIAARPSMGKTSLVLNMAQRNLDINNGVVFFSLEMPAEQLMLRMLSLKTEIPLQRIRVGQLNDAEFNQINHILKDLTNKKFFIDDNSSLSIQQFKTKIRKLVKQNPEIKLIIIDYLQLMSGNSKDRNQEISEISRGLKILARELGMPILALSQLNRSLESREDKRPMLSDLRESGAIEQDADIILFLYRDDYYKRKEAKKEADKQKKQGVAPNQEQQEAMIEKDFEISEIIIGKQRNGPTDTIRLKFEKNLTRFLDLPNKYDENYAPTNTQIEIIEEGGLEMTPL
jgi:replicative DNA helicase